MLKFFLKLAIGIGCIALLIYSGAIDFNILIHGISNYSYIFIALALLALTVPMAAYRWNILLRGQGISLSLGWAMSTTFISQFFNTFLPGAYGGDIVRMALATRATARPMKQLVFSVVVDRLSGLVALLLLAIAVLPALPVENHQRLIWASFALTIGMGGVVCIALITGDAIASLIGKLPAPFGTMGASLIRDVVNALQSYVSRPQLLMTVVGISLLQYVLVLFALLMIGEAMGISGLSLVGYIVAGIWGLVANALPVTPGGLGIGEGAFAKMAAIMARDSDALGYGTIFLVMRVLSIMVSLGGLFPLVFGNVALRPKITESGLAEGHVPQTETMQ